MPPELAPTSGVPTSGLHPRVWAARDPDRAAVTFAPSGRVLTYGRLVERADRCAKLLRSLGVGVGDHIALLVENHPAHFEIAWAAHNAGLLFTPISWRFHPDEIAFILGDCGARILFVSRGQQRLLTALPPDLIVVLIDGDAADGRLAYDAALADQPATPVADERRGTDMVYSSGSTGRPKGIVQKLPDLAIDQLSPLFAVFAERFGWDAATVYLMPAPLYHSGPLRFAMAMQHVGATLVVMEKFDAAAALDLITRHRVMHAHFVPTMLVRLLKLPSQVRDTADLASLRMIIHGAAPCAPDVKRAMIAWVGPILEESYGGSEGNGMTIISSAEWLAHPGSVGRPFVGRIDIIGDDGRDRPVGETGLVYFSGGPAFEYHGNAALTATAYDAQGRSTLGDIGYLDADGYLYLTDRRNHMVVTGGVNVFSPGGRKRPHHAPRRDRRRGVRPARRRPWRASAAVVQPRDIVAAGDALRSELLALCRSRLAGYKTPRGLDFASDLPRHDTGKIYTQLVREQYTTN